MRRILCKFFFSFFSIIRFVHIYVADVVMCFPTHDVETNRRVFLLLFFFLLFFSSFLCPLPLPITDSIRISCFAKFSIYITKFHALKFTEKACVIS